MRTLTLAILLLIAPAWGCAAPGSSQGQVSGTDRNRITREQLETMPSITAFEAVERFHRDWLRARAGTLRTSTGRFYPEVFLDGRPFGTVESLNQFGTDMVEEIRFLSAANATTRYGTGYPGGIIEVITRKNRPH